MIGRIGTASFDVPTQKICLNPERRPLHKGMIHLEALSKAPRSQCLISF